MRKSPLRMWSLALGFASLLTVSAAPAGADTVQDFLIQCRVSCDSVAAAIQQINGARINYTFQNVPGLAASLPAAAAAALQTRPDVVEVGKDLPLTLPEPSVSELAAEDMQVLGAADLTSLTQGAPANYNFNNGLTGAASQHAQGKIGTGIVVAIIDSGTANSPTVPALAGSVIGGESLIPASADPVLSATSTLNNPHGTWVGTMIAGHANFIFSASSALVRGLQLYSPSSVIPCSLVGCPPTQAVIPMIGTAPGAKLYAMKILPSNGGSSPSSRTLAAMDRALTLRRNFDAGMPSVPVNAGCGSTNNPCVYNSLPIQVVNMSLGGGTLSAGRDLRELLTVDMVNAGLVVVVAAGNDGPAALTIGSPGSGRGALCVAAASTPVHERTLRDLQFGFGAGALYRPFNGIQTATFSSRGPTADGRISVDITANGLASFVQSANGGISLASGTSFSSPTVAGAAALLREQFPNASALEIRGALIDSANPALLADGSGLIDQGNGFLDIPAAIARLNAGNIDTSLDRGTSNQSLTTNLAPLGIRTVKFQNNRTTERLTGLKPGQVAQLYVEADEETEQLKISFSNVTPALPPAQQNAFFGDDIFLTVVDSFTSFSTELVQAFVTGNASFTVNRPNSGLVRLAVQGDTTNAGAISADVTIERVVNKLTSNTATGQVNQGDQEVIQVSVPAGTSQLSALLAWRYHWGGYPTNDLDMTLIDPNGNVVPGGATISSPERVTVANPAAGTWTILVDAFLVQDAVHGPDRDHWKLYVSADGNRLKPVS